MHIVMAHLKSKRIHFFPPTLCVFEIKKNQGQPNLERLRIFVISFENISKIRNTSFFSLFFSFNISTFQGHAT